MHDPQYRLAIAWQNTAYNQPPHPSFYLGDSMAAPPVPNIVMVEPVTLPVKIVSFKASSQGKTALIEWSATNETNSDHYIVERSKDGTTFTSIGKVSDKGNTAGVNNYSLVDNSPHQGLNYYRLKQVDKDDYFVYSEIKSVRFSTGKELEVYPNPVTSVVKINLDTCNTKLQMMITGSDGKVIERATGTISQVNNVVNALLPKLKAGYYTIKITDKDKVYNAKLIRQ